MTEQDLKRTLQDWLYDKPTVASTTSASSENPGEEERSSPYLNVDKIKEFLGDDPLIVKELLLLSLVEMDEAVSKLSKAIEEKNLQILKTAGHKLKGTCLISGLEVLLPVARWFENLEEFDQEPISRMMERLTTEVSATRNEIERYLKKFPPGEE